MKSWGGYCPDPRLPPPPVPGFFDPPLDFRPVLDDEFGVYGLTDVGGGLPDEMVIHFPWSDPTQFWAEGGYPFVATVWSSGGSGSIDLGMPPQTEGFDLYWAGQLIEAKILCDTPQTGWMGIPGMFDPEWMIASRLPHDGRLPGRASVGATPSNVMPWHRTELQFGFRTEQALKVHRSTLHARPTE